jgi:hypothetical protein
LNFPYCQSNIILNIIFSSSNPTYPPDILLSFNFVDMRKLKSFNDWNSLDPSSLTKCILEIKNEFIEYNNILISNHPNETIQFHFNTLLDFPNVEYFIRNEEIRIKIPLRIKNLDRFVKEKNNVQNTKKQDLQCYFFINFNDSNEVSK